VTDLEILDTFLRSDTSPDHCMQLSDLDGFLTGIVCSPNLIVPSEWLLVALGSQNIDVQSDILGLIMQRYNEIVAGLNSDPSILEPVFWRAKEGHVIAMDWCEGFMDAFALRRDDWDALMRTQEGRDWMFPILAHQFNEDGTSQVGASEEQIDALLASAAEKIPETVPHIFTFWQTKRTPTPLN